VGFTLRHTEALKIGDPATSRRDKRRLTVDVSHESGHGDDGTFIRGSSQAMECDWHRWFMKLAHDQHVNFTAATMWRAGAGLRF
jgi:hypothetical protein